ncbi:MAG: sigma-70 family RNA polymerase sigma factor [Phycisphaerales bacterium]|nr:sigma-70 family RNA polymerase sigma factor [Phycisphaerales bacterium]
MNETRTDPDLIASIANSENHEAWREFEAWYAPIIHAFCVSRGMAPHDADDIAQDVFIRLTQSSIATKYDPDRGRFRSYLFQVTRSVVSSSKKRIQTEYSIESFEEPSSLKDWNKAWDEECALQAIKHVEQTASAVQKSILNLSLRGSSPKVIAELHGLTIDAVYKIRQRLHASIEETTLKFQQGR